MAGNGRASSAGSVSYTHLDVYKRQVDDYVANFMADPHLKAWIAAAEQETEVLEPFEMGR